MKRKYLSGLVACIAVLAVGAVSASSALAANEFLREEKGSATLVPVGTNFVMENTGAATLTAGTTTVACEKVNVGATVTVNKKETETPVAAVQSVLFSECAETTAPKGKVVVKTETTTPWKLKFKESVGKFTLEAVAAKLELQGLGLTCTVKNAAAAFSMTWTNALLEARPVVTATEQPVALTGTSCPTEGKESVALRVMPNGVADTTGKMYLE
jgi:hypothetical protein